MMMMMMMYDYFGRKELLNCVSELGIKDFDVHILSPPVISVLVHKKFVRSRY